MISRILCRLFPLYFLLPKAEKIGQVHFTRRWGMWITTIKSSHSPKHWAGSARTLGGALRVAFREAQIQPVEQAARRSYDRNAN